LDSILSPNIKRDEVSNIKSDIESIEIKKNNLDIDGLLTANTMSLNDRIMGIDGVQKKLTDEQLLVFPAETFSDTQVTTFLISNKKVLTVRSEMSAFDLRQAGLNLRSSLQFNGTSGLNDLPEFNFHLSYQIFNELFSGALTEFHSIKDLIVIPTWPISNLPLAVLVSDDPTKTDYGYDKQSWLGLEKNISYLPSVSDLKMLEKSNNTELFASLIGFGDPELGQKTNNLRGIKFVNIEDDELSKSYQLDLLPSLPSTAEELQAIKNIFSDGKSEIYTQENATEDAIKSKDLSNYNVLLFATHGVIADEWEFLDEAALVMTPPKNTNTANNDGLLTTSEIRKLNLNADLVVLSACNTASGDNQSDEGLSGLASAFIFAGAKSIMASHWSVESNTTKQLVTTFFKNLKTSSKMTRSEAMRLSMKKLFSDHRYKHPIFWAPFILVGQS
jgi:CHAT domain-containing protein